MHRNTPNHVAEFGQGLRSAAPGTYAVCQCPVTLSCTVLTPESYRTRIGTLQLEGPDVGHDVVCYRGQPCKITGIGGLNMGRADRLSVGVRVSPEWDISCLGVMGQGPGTFPELFACSGYILVPNNLA